MKTFIWINTVVICSISWIFVSVAQSQNVTVQPGQSVTLWSLKPSKDTVATWSRLINTTNVSCISSMASFKGKAQFCDGFNIRTFQMKINISGMYLKTKNVDLSGIYFYEIFNIGKITYYVKHLNVEGNEETQDDLDTESEKSYETTYVMSFILGGLIVFLLVVVTVLVVSLGKLQTASGKRQDTQQHEHVDCADLKAAALSVYSPAVRSRRPASQRQAETHVTYASSK